jgi:hypothetical protein
MKGKWRVHLLGGIIFSIACAACTTGKYTTRSRSLDVQALESSLRRGASTMEDVERLMGKPDGTGSMLLPIDVTPVTTWVYERIELESNEGRMTVLQDVMLVFFREGKFDGFFWFSDIPGTWQ